MVVVSSFLIIAIIVLVVFIIISLLIFFLQRFCRHRSPEIDRHSMARSRHNNITNNEEINLHQNIQIQLSSQCDQDTSTHQRMSLTNGFLLPSEFETQHQRRHSQLSVTSSRSGSIEVRRDIGSPSSNDTKKSVRFDSECGSSGNRPKKMSYSYQVGNTCPPSPTRPLKPILKSPTIHTFRSYDGFDRASYSGIRVCRIARNTTETIV